MPANNKPCHWKWNRNQPEPSDTVACTEKVMKSFSAWTRKRSLGSGWFLFHFQWHGLLFAGTAPVLAYALLLSRSSAFAQLGPPPAQAGPARILTDIDRVEELP